MKKPSSKFPTSKFGFSLLEVSVSLVVIAVLMSIVSQGVKIIASSKLSTARSLTSKSPVPNITGLLAWYETTSTDSFKTIETSDGSQITTWYDISPDSIPEKKNTLTRVASSAVIYQASGINKIPSVYFVDAGTRRLSISTLYQGTSTQNTVFAVLKPFSVSVGFNGHVFDSGSADYSTFSLLPTGIHRYSGINTDAVASNCCSANENYIMSVYYNGSSSKTYVNDAINKVGGVNVNPGTSVVTGITVGNNLDGGYPFDGLVSEIIVYDRILKIQERKDIMRYLGKKYGIKVNGI